MSIILQAQHASTEDECPVCHGNGWLLYDKTVSDYPDVDNPQSLEFARPCPQCNGSIKQGNIGLPLSYRNADLSQFNWRCYGNEDMSQRRKIAESFVSNYQKWVDECKCLYLWSRTAGTGKTFLASSIVNRIAADGVDVRFVGEMDYLSQIKAGFNTAESGMNRASDHQKYIDCALLVFDDVGVSKVSDWVDETIYRLVNTRMENGRITIYTSNLPPENLRFSSRVVSRIIKSSIVFKLPEVSIRAKEAAREQDEFIRSVLK